MVNQGKNEWQNRLNAMLEALDAEEELGRQDRAVVTLDQQSIGRLSRMDAMQRQAMAEAQSRRKESQRVRIRAALSRIEDGEFGECFDCGEEIERKRLELDPTVPKCLSCAKG